MQKPDESRARNVRVHHAIPGRVRVSICDAEAFDRGLASCCRLIEDVQGVRVAFYRRFSGNLIILFDESKLSGAALLDRVASILKERQADAGDHTRCRRHDIVAAATALQIITVLSLGLYAEGFVRERARRAIKEGFT